MDNADDTLKQAVALHRSGRLSEAGAIYDEMLRIQPSAPGLLNAAAVLALQLGDPERAAGLLERSLSARPDQAEAWVNLGTALVRLGRLEDALMSFDQAAARMPGHPAILLGRGNVLRGLHRLDEALASFDEAIAGSHGYAEAWLNRGNILRDMKRFEAAAESYRRAVDLRPDLAITHLNLGNALRDLDVPLEALASYERALAADPNSADALINRGIVLADLRRFDEALACFEQVVARLENADTAHPSLAEAYWNMALVKLLLGDFESGWRLYEWRWRREQGTASRHTERHFPQPKWLGDGDIAGKTLLITSEQGLGDILQFCRYAPLVAERGARVLLEAPAPLAHVLVTLPGEVTILDGGGPLPDFDLHCPVMSLPLAFGTRLTSVPNATPYLGVGDEKRRAWQFRLGTRRLPRIGLAWSGSASHAGDGKRSLRLDSLVPLLSLPLEFHVLQKDIRPHDEAVLRENDALHRHDTELNDFSDTAALIDAMDLVITVDTSVAHLAGALGRETWLLLPFAPDFRWLLDRTDSPWYPGMTLFRQRARGDWAGVVADVAARLGSERFPETPYFLPQ